MRDATDRLEITIGALFVLATLSGLALAVTYWEGGQTQLEGIFLALALAALAVGIGMWAHHGMPGGGAVEQREPLRSSTEDRNEAVAGFEQGEHILGRRGLLVRLLVLGAGTIGAALLLPIRSLGPRPGDALRRTPWREGRRLVTESDEPVRPDDLDIGGFLTVFPDGERSPGDAQTVLIRLPDGVNRPRAGREGWTVANCIAYSKVCTHAGCPVGLYQALEHQLVCPCHQSTFDVTDGARPSFGPATQPLPQLPIALDEEGFLVAQSDYPEPVGPAWWGSS